MFASEPIPINLPDGKLALTYDDGPGPNTLEIATFLSSYDVRATFFTVGKHVRERRDIVRAVRALGHVIGNHTDTHFSWYDRLRDEPRSPELEKELLGEVAAADRNISEYLGGPSFLRTPGGEWRAWIAEVLNQTELGPRYVGPINWTIPGHVDWTSTGDYGGDWEIGSERNGKLYSLQECAENFLADIREKKKGVVLLHDWSADPGEKGKDLQAKNRTLELTQWLIPRLSGFDFVTLDAISAPCGSS